MTCWRRRRAGSSSCSWRTCRRPTARSPARSALGQLAELIGASLYDSATRRRTQFLAIFELTLEATRLPGLGQALAQIAAATLEATVAEHRALGLDTSPEQVQLLLTLFAGALLALVTGPREAVTPGAALTLAQSLVTGALSPSPP